MSSCPHAVHMLHTYIWALGMLGCAVWRHKRSSVSAGPDCSSRTQVWGDSWKGRGVQEDWAGPCRWPQGWCQPGQGCCWQLQQACQPELRSLLCWKATKVYIPENPPPPHLASLPPPPSWMQSRLWQNLSQATCFWCHLQLVCERTPLCSSWQYSKLLYSRIRTRENVKANSSQVLLASG